jgi:hypothetical protein
VTASVLPPGYDDRLPGDDAFPFTATRRRRCRTINRG